MLDMDKLLEATRRTEAAQTLVDKASTVAELVWSVHDELQQELAIHQAEVATVEADLFVQESRQFLQKISALRPCSGFRRTANSEVARLKKMLFGFAEKLAILKDIRQEIAHHRSLGHYDVEDLNLLEDEDAFWHGEVPKSSSSLADVSTSIGGPSSSSTSLENEEETDAVHVRTKKREVFELPAKPRPDQIMHLDTVLSIMRKAQVSLAKHQCAVDVESLNEEVQAAETLFTKVRENNEKETALEARVEASSEDTPSSSSSACPAQEQSQAAGHRAQEQASLEAQLEGQAQYQEVPANDMASNVIDWFISALNLQFSCCMARSKW